MTRIPSPRELIGKRITGFRANSVRDTAGHVIHNPIIDLDDGSFLFFVTEENSSGSDYGVFIGRAKRKP